MVTKKRDIKKRSWSQIHESAYKKEIAAVAFGILAIFVMLSFFSFSLEDNTFLHYTSDSDGVSNWAGSIGAHIAALFFYLFGASAYLLLLLLGLPVWMLLDTSSQCEWHRVGALSGLMIVAAALCSVHDILLLHGVGGGVIGELISSWCVPLIGEQGLHVVLWGCAWMFINVIAQISFVSWIWRGAATLLSSIQAFGARLILRKKSADDTLGIAGGASKVNVFQDDIFQNIDDMLSLQSDSGPVVFEDAACHENILEALAQQEHLLSKKFLEYPLRKLLQHTTVLNVPYSKIPNTVLTYNMFAIREGYEKSLYELLLGRDKRERRGGFVLPDQTLLSMPPVQEKYAQTAEASALKAQKVEEKLQHFGVKGSVVAIKPGPLVTMFEYKPEIDSKISKILALEDDLAMALTAQSMRIIAPIPGKNVIGFEISNNEREEVFFAHIFAHKVFQEASARLPIIFGVDSIGNPVVADLASTPHLLVGGATGSGKSVGLNVMLCSMLCKLTPDDLKLILIDPKRLEFTPYADIPHLLFPIVTQASRASAVLSWVVQEMEVRYDAMAAVGVRGISEYKALAAQKGKTSPQLRSMPYLVVIIDELADLMMVAGKEVETHIVRIAQMARAAGIHMIVATQRPSVDVVTGLIKVNFPSRVAFRVSSKVDSRTILDHQGAEKLLGRGDMLFMHSSSPELKRVHCGYISDADVVRLSDFWRNQAQPQYLDINEIVLRNNLSSRNDVEDELYVQLCELIKTIDEISISMIQRHYRIGFNRSARLIEKLELDGLIAPAQGSKPRKVLH